MTLTIDQSQMVGLIVKVIRNSRIDLSNEKAAQADIAKVFLLYDIPCQREVRLRNCDIIDFTIGRIGLEIKLRGARKIDIFRQLHRYSLHADIDCLILASNISMGLPESIVDKSVYFVRLGEGWI